MAAFDGVVVVGSGPTGLSAALALAQRNVPVLVLEALDGLSDASRASTFHPPTLELLDFLGVYRELATIGLRVDTFQFRSRKDGLLAELCLDLLDGRTKFPFRLQCEQSKLTPILLAHLEQTSIGSIRFGHEVRGVRNSDGDVVVDAVVDGSPITIEAPYVVGADGAGSAVRQSLGLDFDGMTYPERFLVVTTAFPFEEALPDISPVNYVADADEWLVLLRIPGAWRVLFPIGPHEEVDADRADVLISERLGGVIPAAAAEPVVEWSIYNVHQRVASTFREGRVLLAGDAAHVNSPIGGMGMNSGIHDAFMLADRLASVWQGRDPAVLLDDYAQERRRFALDYVQVATDRNTRNLALTEPEAIAAYRAEIAELGKDPSRAERYLVESSMLDGARSLVDELIGGR